MNYNRLETSLIDVIKEEQAKLGYMKEKISLYYPLSSLNHFFESNADAAGMMEILKDFPAYMKEKFADERNSSGKLDFEHSYLRRQINELASIEYGKAGLSIFDVALLLKVSTPSAEFDKTVGKGIMREILTLIYEYAQTMVLEADLDRIYGKFVLEQFEMFDKNIDWYMDNWKDNFSDYINDLMRIAVSDIERKKLTDIYEKMRKIMKESSKKRG